MAETNTKHCKAIILQLKKMTAFALSSWLAGFDSPMNCSVLFAQTGTQALFFVLLLAAYEYSWKLLY